MARKYTDEFKREAIALVQGGTPVREAATSLGMPYWTLYGWVRTAQVSTPAPKTTLSAEEENRRLREENRRLKLEREILKKATAFFASDKP